MGVFALTVFVLHNFCCVFVLGAYKQGMRSVYITLFFTFVFAQSVDG